MPNESKTPEEYLSDALDLMVKAKWIKQYGPSAKGFGDARAQGRFQRVVKLSYAKSLDTFDVLRVKDVYAPKRKQGEREH